MDMVTPFAPNPGDAQPGNLYADLGTRTLWLGVEAVVDPAQAVLISDIVGLQASIAAGDAAERTYVNAQLLLKAPLASPPLTGTPTAPTAAAATNTTQIATTAFVKTAVTASSSSVFVRGMIMQYSGLLSDIGVGGLAGWSLCDGSNGTPDLRERFVLAAGSRAIGAMNAATSFDTAAAGGHDHTVNATALTLAQIPSHNHTGATTDRNVGHSHYVNLNSGQESADHSHGTRMFSRLDNGAPVGGTWAVGGNNKDEGTYQTAGRSAAHVHNVQGWTSGEDTGHWHGIYAEGSNQGHSHTLVGGGGVHQHNITASNLRETLPFYALAFIMKL